MSGHSGISTAVRGTATPAWGLRALLGAGFLLFSWGMRSQGFGSGFTGEFICSDKNLGQGFTRGELEGAWPGSGKWPNFHVHWGVAAMGQKLKLPEAEFVTSVICAGAEVPVLSL